MKSIITGAAQNILDLIDEALSKVADGRDDLTSELCFTELAKKLNANENGKNTFNLSASTLQKHLYYKVRKLVNAEMGNYGVSFISVYLNRLSQFVYSTNFEKKFGQFKGTKFSLSEGVTKLPKELEAEKYEEFVKGLEELGIIGITSKLSKSQFEPEQCMNEAKHSLFFMGLLGSKWVKDLESFKEFLSLIQSKNGNVRYLLINPLSQSFKILKNMRGEYLKDESTSVFKKLITEYDCLEVRFYDFIPSFRLVFVDHSILGVSRYKLDKKSYIRSNKGWEAPHLVINSGTGFWSLYEPFLSYYNNVWHHSKELKKVIK